MEFFIFYSKLYNIATLKMFQTAPEYASSGPHISCL